MFIENQCYSKLFICVYNDYLGGQVYERFMPQAYKDICEGSRKRTTLLLRLTSSNCALSGKGPCSGTVHLHH